MKQENKKDLKAKRLAEVMRKNLLRRKKKPLSSDKDLSGGDKLEREGQDDKS